MAAAGLHLVGLAVCDLLGKNGASQLAKGTGISAKSMSNEKGSVGLGLAFCWGLNIVQVMAAWVLIFVVMPVGLVLLGGIGLAQLAYIVPLCLRYKAKGKTDFVKGMIIAASITALLNVGCWTTAGFLSG